MSNYSVATLHKRIAIPDAFLNETAENAWGGDIRIGDLTGNGSVDFLVYKSLGGIHPCFLGAFTLEGEHRCRWTGRGHLFLGRHGCSRSE